MGGGKAAEKRNGRRREWMKSGFSPLSLSPNFVCSLVINLLMTVQQVK
jgi:hypothetical protein